MDNTPHSENLNFDVLLASLLTSKESLSNDATDKSTNHTGSIDSFGSWYEAD